MSEQQQSPQAGAGAGEAPGEAAGRASAPSPDSGWTLCESGS